MFRVDLFTFGAGESFYLLLIITRALVKVDFILWSHSGCARLLGAYCEGGTVSRGWQLRGRAEPVCDVSGAARYRQTAVKETLRWRCFCMRCLVSRDGMLLGVSAFPLMLGFQAV